MANFNFRLCVVVFTVLVVDSLRISTAEASANKARSLIAGQAAPEVSGPPERSYSLPQLARHASEVVHDHDRRLRLAPYLFAFSGFLIGLMIGYVLKKEAKPSETKNQDNQLLENVINAQGRVPTIVDGCGGQYIDAEYLCQNDWGAHKTHAISTAADLSDIAELACGSVSWKSAESRLGDYDVEATSKRLLYKC